MNVDKAPPSFLLRRASKPIRTDVKGAPFKIGQKVRVYELSDEQGDASLLGKDGIVEHYDYSCGCGQSYPDDPMVGVRFASGRLEEFWKEELRVKGRA
jgi:hypothetical protein